MSRHRLTGESDHVHASPQRIKKLSDASRLLTQVGEADLARLLALRGDEDILDLGSGTGFYTDHIAALTTGAVYALELLPQMNAHYRERGLPANVRLLQGDMTALPIEDTTGSDPRQETHDLLRPTSVDVACTIATWHEIEGRLDVVGVASVLRPKGRLLVVDWRTDPDGWDNGPPRDERFSSKQVVSTIASHFTTTSVEHLGRYMYAIKAVLS